MDNFDLFTSLKDMGEYMFRITESLLNEKGN